MSPTKADLDALDKLVAAYWRPRCELTWDERQLADSAVSAVMGEYPAIAAEALELIAWAEERKVDIDYNPDKKWACWVFGEKLGDEKYFKSDTLLGCIRAAKEAA